jgi:glycogen debranching enzyme
MLRRTLLTSGALAGLAAPRALAADAAPPGSAELRFPTLRTSNRVLDTAWRIALGDLAGNVTLFQSGLLTEPLPVLIAGLGYRTPWTRDAAINAWNGYSLVAPRISRNTLLAVLERGPNGVAIAAGDQYWDAIVWVTGAWHHYLATGDREFLKLAYEAATNSLVHFEETEFDEADGLFRGPGWSDGIAAYPDEYVCNGDSAINVWPRCHPSEKAAKGWGIPMKALSTNCLYYNAYRVHAQMAAELGLAAPPADKATRLREAINKVLWSEEEKHYRFLTGIYGPCDRQEALGHAYALMFGIADEGRAREVLARQYVAPAGVPAVWPEYERYRGADGKGFSRHAGAVWAQIQGMWAHAAARHGRTGILSHELTALAAHAARDRQFAELYHPLTGEVDGGLQERRGTGIVRWESQPRQSWAASAFIRMCVSAVAGLELAADGVRFRPSVPDDLATMDIANLDLRGCRLDASIRGTGSRVRKLEVAGRELHPNEPIPWSVFERPSVRVAIQL